MVWLSLTILQYQVNRKIFDILKNLIKILEYKKFKIYFLGIPFYTSNADGTDKFNDVPVLGSLGGGEVLIDGFNISKCLMLNVSSNSFVGKSMKNACLKYVGPVYRIIAEKQPMVL